MLVSASFSCRFRLLLSLNGRLFVEFLLTKVPDDTVARAFSLKTTKCAFNAFVFANSNRRHSFQPSFANCVSFLYPVIITSSTKVVKSFFAVFSHFFRFMGICKQVYRKDCVSLTNFVDFIAQARNLPQGAYTKGKRNHSAFLPLRIRIRKSCTPIFSFPWALLAVWV